MALNTKAIKRRIKSVGNTKKITKAMELVSAAKMRKAVAAAVNSRAYATMAAALLDNLSASAEVTLPLLAVRPIQHVLLILITSNRGLCGSFNANIIRKTAAKMRDPKQFAGQLAGAEEIKVDVIGVGKKGAEFAKKMGYNLIASFTDLDDTPALSEVLPISNMAVSAFEQKKYDQAVIAYTDFKSALTQTARLRQVLPVSARDLEATIAEIGEQDIKPQIAPVATMGRDYVFEPNQEQLLTTILPRLVETQIYQSMLESAASEHSARMLAMRSASDAAKDMIRDLNLNYNKARQAGITQEIAEIAGGAAALQ